MGRHSTADGNDEPAVVFSAEAGERASGRHHRADAVEDALITTSADSGTQADLRLLRETPALRARCAAVVVVPFLLYTAVLVVIGRVGIVLLWVWVPAIAAGVGVGGLLDMAHRRGAREGEPSSAGLARARGRSRRRAAPSVTRR